MQLRPNFKKSEIECPCCGMMNANDSVLDKLQQLRDDFGKPVIPSSFCRCQQYNDSLDNSSKSSLHIKGQAGDLEISQLETGDKKRFVKLCLEIFRYVRVYEKHVHVDERPYDGFSVGNY